MQRLHLHLLAAAAALAACMTLAAPALARQTAETIWFGGSILTMSDKAMRAEAVAVACPKLDNANAHFQKLIHLFRDGGLKTAAVLRMEVPCCGALSNIAAEALWSVGWSVLVWGAHANAHATDASGNRAIGHKTLLTSLFPTRCMATYPSGVCARGCGRAG